MILLIGLGNPGKDYENNRHNVGFLFLDSVLTKADNKGWRMENKFEAELSEVELNGKKVVLVKPQTFMNDSGCAVKKVKDFYKINTDEIFVVHDDLDIRLGEYKIQKGKGPKLHNGIESIEEKLGTKEFTRIRIGVDNRNPENRMPGEAYVLQNFTHDEMNDLNSVFQKAYQEFLY